MAMAVPERSKDLLGLDMPCFKWGQQRLLRCVRVGIDNNFETDSKRAKSSGVEATTVPSPDLRSGDGGTRLKAPPAVEGDGGNDESAAPWNLRTRRSACKAPQRVDDSRLADSVRKNKAIDSANERVKFSVSLSKEEIEKDFLDFIGIKPPRRPKKRSRVVQKCLDSLFPGLWLSEVTLDTYKVARVPE